MVNLCRHAWYLFATSFLLPSKLIPVIYLLRGILLVPVTALLYFALLPARFPHTPDSYMEGLVTAGIALISIVPLLFGLTYYIFDFGLLKKAFLTAITMTHLALFLPLQVLLQALVSAKNGPVHASALHYLRHAGKHSDHHRLLLLGHDLVLPVSQGNLITLTVAIFGDHTSPALDEVGGAFLSAPRTRTSCFRAGRYLLSLHTNEGIIQLRERIESGSLAAILLCLRTVSLPCVRLV